MTDMLMAGLVALEPHGIYVDFPDEPKTGADMDWVFVAPRQINGGRYFRILLQAKRATYVKWKTGGYWYYQHLDHSHGKQAQTLVAQSASSVLPMYLLYHPASALLPAVGAMPGVAGINAVPADVVAPAVNGGCKRPVKAVDNWRPHFLELSDILCWAPMPSSGPEANIDSLPHPQLVARRMLVGGVRHVDSGGRPQIRDVQAAREIPEDVVRRIEGKSSPEDRRRLERPRVVFSTRNQLS